MMSLSEAKGEIYMHSEIQFTEKPHCYAILPAKVRYDTGLSSTAKLLYADIESLTHQTGYCYATNLFLAWLQNISVRQVITCVKLLEKQGHIRVVKENNQRRIYVTEGVKKSSQGMKKSSSGYEKNFTYRGEEKFTHNNIKYNNKFNNYNNPQKDYDVFQDTMDHEALERAVWEKLGK